MMEKRGDALRAQILHGIEQAAPLYYRLVLVAALPGAGKSKALRDVQERLGAPLVNLSLEMSRRLLDFPAAQRPVRADRVVDEIVAVHRGDLVLLDNTEVLFDASLKIDPLRCLQRVSRYRTVVASWNGAVASGELIYARPGHPEYRSYPTGELLIAS